MKQKHFILLILTFFALTACGQNTAEPTPQSDIENLIQTAAALTLEARTQLAPPTETVVPTETLVPTTPPTPTPDLSVPLTVLSPLMNLRGGPGTLFDVLATFSEGTVVYAAGMTPAGDWMYVNAPVDNGVTWTGWLAASYLDTSQIENSLPIYTWNEDLTLSGRVTDEATNPISGIRIAATATIAGSEIRAEAVSALDGSFNIYIPENLAGTYNVEIVAINCTSNIADVQPDGGCATDDHFAVNWQITTTVPQPPPIIFSYEHAAAYLEGKVAYQDGNGASEILVRATRISDGVTSEKVTPVGGEFKLPLGIGEWEIVAVRFMQDGTPLIGETRVYTVTSQGQTFEPLEIPYTEIQTTEE